MQENLRKDLTSKVFNMDDMRNKDFQGIQEFYKMNNDDEFANFLYTVLRRYSQNVEYVYEIIYYSLPMVVDKIYQDYNFLYHFLEGIPEVKLRSEFFTAICLKFFGDGKCFAKNVTDDTNKLFKKMNTCKKLSGVNYISKEDSKEIMNSFILIKIIEYYLNNKNLYNLNHEIVESMTKKFMSICKVDNLKLWKPSIFQSCLLPVALNVFCVDNNFYMDSRKIALSNILKYILKANLIIEESYVLQFCKLTIEQNDFENWEYISKYVIFNWNKLTLLTRCCLPYIILIDKLINEVEVLTVIINEKNATNFKIKDKTYANKNICQKTNNEPCAISRTSNFVPNTKSVKNHVKMENKKNSILDLTQLKKSSYFHKAKCLTKKSQNDNKTHHEYGQTVKINAKEKKTNESETCFASPNVIIEKKGNNIPFLNEKKLYTSSNVNNNKNIDNNSLNDKQKCDCNFYYKNSNVDGINTALLEKASLLPE